MFEGAGKSRTNCLLPTKDLDVKNLKRTVLSLNELLMFDGSVFWMGDSPAGAGQWKVSTYLSISIYLSIYIGM